MTAGGFGTSHELSYIALTLHRLGYLRFLEGAVPGLLIPGATANGDACVAGTVFGLLALGFRFSRLPLCSRFAIAPSLWVLVFRHTKHSGRRLESRQW
jgi:hypothetical protein